MMSSDRGDAMPDDAKVRAFVAVELPRDLREWCADAQERSRRLLGSAASAVRWVDPEGIHLTLKFLGYVPEARLSTITDRLQESLVQQSPFSLAVGHLGVFPNVRSPRAMWLAVFGDQPALRACQRRVEDATVPLGFAPEKRPFQPHLTLGRVRETATSQQLAAIGSLMAEEQSASSRHFAVTSARLMESRLSPSGARYSQLAAFPFEASATTRYPG